MNAHVSILHRAHSADDFRELHAEEQRLWHALKLAGAELELAKVSAAEARAIVAQRAYDEAVNAWSNYSKTVSSAIRAHAEAVFGLPADQIRLHLA